MLMRTDPFRELDRMTDELWGNGGRRRGLSTMALDAYRDGDQFVVHFDLPGVDPDSIEVTVENNVLNVSASRSWRSEDEAEGRTWVASERLQGTFQRQLFLGETLDTDRIEAAYDRGVLTLTIPVTEKAKPRKIAVAGGSGQAAIDATSHPAA